MYCLKVLLLLCLTREAAAALGAAAAGSLSRHVAPALGCLYTFPFADIREGWKGCLGPYITVTILFCLYFTRVSALLYINFCLILTIRIVSINLYFNTIKILINSCNLVNKLKYFRDLFTIL